MDNKNNKIIITNPVKGDEKQIVLVHKETWLSTYPNEKYGISREDILLKDFDSDEKLNNWKKIIKNNGKNDVYLCVAKNKDKIIGFCQVSKGKKHNELKTIYILPEYQKMGVGKKLIEKGLEWLGKNKDIIVEVVEYNEKAIKFYEKYSFVKTGVVSDCKFPNGKTMPEIQLIL